MKVLSELPRRRRSGEVMLAGALLSMAALPCVAQQTTGQFNLTVRNYWPMQAVLEGSYKLPPIQVVFD